MLLADRGYDANWIRALVTKRRARANIPPRSNRTEPICFSPHLYRPRNPVEPFFNKIKQRRQVATRFDKLAANSLAFVQLVSIWLWCVLMSPRPSIQSGRRHAGASGRTPYCDLFSITIATTSAEMICAETAKP
jgi:transposase